MILSAAVLATGCDRKQTTRQQLDGAQAKAAEVAQNIQECTFLQKDEFVKQERAHLADLNRDLDELAVSVAKASDSVKADAQPRIDALRAQTARLNRQLDAASGATESGWEKFKVDVRETRDASKVEFDKARQWLSEKIAP